jgi:hypothetical protein
VQSNKPYIYICYSHKDESWKDRLVLHLNILKQQDLLDSWNDQHIKTGDSWLDEFDRAIEQADIAILLISADFLTSRFILDREIPRMVERHEKDGLLIMPIVVRPCFWQAVSWLGPMQVFPRNGKALSLLGDADVEMEITNVVREVYNWRSLP